MPIVDIEPIVPGVLADTPRGLSTTPGALGADDPVEPERPGFLDALNAHFSYDNLIASVTASEAWRAPVFDDPNFDAWKAISGTDLEPYWERYTDVGNQARFDAVTHDIRREKEARKIIDATPGWMSFPMTFAAGMLDPTILIPGGAFVRGAKGGLSVGRSALNVGLATGAAVSVQEAGLQATQQLRTAQESGTAIGASVLLGGILGAGGARLLNRAEWREVVGALDRQINDPSVVQDNTPFPAPVGAAVGAQVAPQADIDALTISGRAAGLAAKPTAFLNPGLRLMRSPSVVSRETAANTFEMTQYLKGADADQAAPQAVETLRKEWNAGLMKAADYTRTAFSAYRKRAGSAGLSRRDFAEAVGKAMRRADEHEIPEVANAAKSWRASVLDPLRDAAIEAKMMPEDVSVEEAASYFSRMYNRPRLIAEEHMFKRTVTEWLMPRLDEDHETAKRLDVTNERFKKWNSEIAKLEAKLERVEAAEKQAAARVKERDMEATKTQTREETLEERQVRMRSEAEELADNIDLMHELARNTPVLSKPLQKARDQFEKKLASLRVIGAQAREVGSSVTRNQKRLSVLEARLEKVEGRKAVINEMLDAGREFRESLRDALEREVVGWGGKSGDPVRKAIELREERAAQRIASGLIDTPRLRTADSAVDKAVRHIVKQLEGRLSDLERATTARDMANEIYDKLTGRQGDSVRPYAVKIDARGPFKARTFHAPDELIERWLESDIDLVGRRYHRIMSADVELTKKFGSVDMAEQIKAIREDYQKLRAQTSDEKELARLTKAENADVRDLKGIRDLIRGTYDLNGWENNYGRIARMANMLNYIRSMGQVSLSSLPEAYRTAMVHGLRPFMETLSTAVRHPAAFKMGVREAKLAGNITERALSNRLATLAEIGDFYTSRGPVEKFMANMVEAASTWNGIRIWTDGAKMIAGVATQNRILDAASSWATTSQKNKRYLRYLGLSEPMAQRIAKQFDEFGETVDGVRVANTEEWGDDAARTAYRAAVNKDIDTQVVTRSVADIPLFANTPLGRLLFQFNTFNLASHQRVLLRGLQEGPARFVQSAIAMTSIGMLVTWLQAKSANRDVPDPRENPGWWIGEGIDRGGIFMVPMQLANAAEKIVGVNPIKAPIKAFDEDAAQSLRLYNRNLASFLGGPTLGLIEDAATVAHIPTRMLAGEDITEGQRNAAERLVPFNSYVGVRQMFRYIVNPPD